MKCEYLGINRDFTNPYNKKEIGVNKELTKDIVNILKNKELNESLIKKLSLEYISSFSGRYFPSIPILVGIAHCRDLVVRETYRSPVLPGLGCTTYRDIIKEVVYTEQKNFFIRNNNELEYYLYVEIVLDDIK